MGDPALPDFPSRLSRNRRRSLAPRGTLRACLPVLFSERQPAPVTAPAGAHDDGVAGRCVRTPGVFLLPRTFWRCRRPGLTRCFRLQPAHAGIWRPGLDRDAHLPDPARLDLVHLAAASPRHLGPASRQPRVCRTARARQAHGLRHFSDRGRVARGQASGRVAPGVVPGPAADNPVARRADRDFFRTDSHAHPLCLGDGLGSL